MDEQMMRAIIQLLKDEEELKERRKLLSEKICNRMPEELFRGVVGDKLIVVKQLRHNEVSMSVSEVVNYG